jgi:hypothetical protein
MVMEEQGKQDDEKKKKCEDPLILLVANGTNSLRLWLPGLFSPK